MDELVKKLIAEGILKTPRIIDAFRAIDRKDFVPEEFKAQAYVDEPLPIGSGQTISQPYTVAFMLELLQAQKGDSVLDIGAGSGWQAVLLAHIVGESGRVVAVERVKEVCDLGARNIAKYAVRTSIEWILGDAGELLQRKANYERVIAAAALEWMPKEWLSRLNTGGRLVVPVRGSIWLYEKRENGEVIGTEFPGFAFVPFISTAK